MWSIAETVAGAVPPVAPRLSQICVCELPHMDRVGSPALIGIDANDHIALEIMYGADDWLAQCVFAADGTLIDQRDENYGHNNNFEPLDLTAFHSEPLEIPAGAQRSVFVGGRWRGLRETDRVLELLHSLNVSDKMALSSELVADGLPGPILGIVESRILAAASITERWTLLCRQIRVAFSVTVSRDADGISYDYDSRPLYLAEWFDHLAPVADQAHTIDEAAGPLSQRLALSRATFGVYPTDLMYSSSGRRLYVVNNPDNLSPATMTIFHCN